MSYHNVREALAEAAEMLQRQGLSSPRLDAEVLLAHVLGITRTQLFIRSTDPVPEQAAGEFAGLVQRRMAREPIAYIIGEKEFMSLTFKVNRDVLIPRPETELLVEWILEKVKKDVFRDKPVIVDVGTGSGAIAVSISANLPEALVWGIDIHSNALAVAGVNAARMGAAGRIRLCKSDLLSDLPVNLWGGVDFIAANLPYIPSGEVPALMPDVAGYEPFTALDGGVDGLDLYRRLIPQAAGVLRNGGWLGMEIDPRQTSELKSLLSGGVWEQNVIVLQDYAGHDRFVAAQKIE